MATTASAGSHENSTSAPARLEVKVSYGGLTHTFVTEPHQTVGQLLELALNHFGIQTNRHIQALFTEKGAELDNASTLEDAGVKPGTHLLLRQSEVRGGASCTSTQHNTARRRREG